MVLLICYFYFIYIYAKYIDRGVGFRSHLMADAGWSERRRPTTKVLEQRASGKPADDELVTAKRACLPEP